jgi:hypothetical protein
MLLEPQAMHAWQVPPTHLSQSCLQARFPGPGAAPRNLACSIGSGDSSQAAGSGSTELSSSGRRPTGSGHCIAPFFLRARPCNSHLGAASPPRKKKNVGVVRALSRSLNRCLVESLELAAGRQGQAGRSREAGGGTQAGRALRWFGYARESSSSAEQLSTGRKACRVRATRGGGYAATDRAAAACPTVEFQEDGVSVVLGGLLQEAAAAASRHPA